MNACAANSADGRFDQLAWNRFNQSTGFSMADDKITPLEDSFTTVPQTIEGWCILHQMFRIKWRELKLLDDAECQAAASQAAEAIVAMEQRTEGPSAAFSLIGHKGDLMLIH